MRGAVPVNAMSDKFCYGLQMITLSVSLTVPVNCPLLTLRCPVMGLAGNCSAYVSALFRQIPAPMQMELMMSDDLVLHVMHPAPESWQEEADIAA
jgi:hypothetical protein